MYIHLNDSDISQMPEALRHSFLKWLPEHLKTNNPSWSQRLIQKPSQPDVSCKQLHIFDNLTQEENAEKSHVRLSQLFDSGITRKGMSVRVKLKRGVAKKLHRDYIDGLEISATGTIVYNGEEFDKPSPLAAKFNGGAVNGWEYIEVKKDNQWIRLEELRQIWRSSNDQEQFTFQNFY
jgi:allantoicase